MNCTGNRRFAVALSILAAGAIAALGASRQSPPAGSPAWDYAVLSCRIGGQASGWRLASPNDNLGPAPAPEFAKRLGRTLQPDASAEFEFVTAVAARGWELVSHDQTAIPRSFTLTISNGNSLQQPEIRTETNEQWWFRRPRP